MHLLWNKKKKKSTYLQLNHLACEHFAHSVRNCTSISIGCCSMFHCYIRYIIAHHEGCWHTRSICSIWSLSIFRCIVSIEQDSEASPNLSPLITVVQALWAKGRLSVCLAEWTDEGPWGHCGPTMLDGDQIRAVCNMYAGQRLGL